MENNKIFTMSFNKIYPLYLKKAEKKGRSKAELDEILYWLTGYSENDINNVLLNNIDFKTFFDNAPNLNPARSLIQGVVCGVRVEDIKDPLMREIRYLDKLIDELAKGKSLDKILRKNS